MPKDYFKILGIDKSADKEEIKKAFRVLAKKYHPDINRAPGADQIFIEINEAYEVLMRMPEAVYHEPDETDIHDTITKDYIDELRRKAEEQARMKYEKFVKQHEAFQTSGIYDISLVLKIIGRVLLIFITLILFALPIVLFFQEWFLIFMVFLFWPFAIFITLKIYEKRKHYFMPGKFYYNFNKIKKYFTDKVENPPYNCFYCKDEKANSKFYKIYLLKVKDVKLDNVGPIIHHASYKRTYKTIKIPRSQKALINHSISSVLKFLSFFVLPFFVPLNSFLWRMFISILCGVLLSESFLILTRTRSKVGYLLNRTLIIKIFIWITALVACTNFSNGFFNLSTYEAVNPIFFLLILFDPIYEQIVKPTKSKGFKMLKPIIPYYSELNKYFEKKYQYYLDIPFWTIIYPLFKWIFG